jgi:hypothetical protein
MAEVFVFKLSIDLLTDYASLSSLINKLFY